MAKKASDETVTRPTITINFAEDSDLYDLIVSNARKERRSPAQYLLLHLVNEFGITQAGNDE